jgi:hypothetical protein
MWAEEFGDRAMTMDRREQIEKLRKTVKLTHQVREFRVHKYKNHRQKQVIVIVNSALHTAARVGEEKFARRRAGQGAHRAKARRELRLPGHAKLTMHRLALQ